MHSPPFSSLTHPAPGYPHTIIPLCVPATSLTAVWLAEKAPTAKLTFGYHRYEIMGAVMSVVLIWGITGVLIYEAVNRFIDPPKHVDGE